MLRSLQIFRDLVETRSFTETGRRNYLTQSAVSQHLSTLERKLGHRLIERENRRQIGLTQAGQLVYAAATNILREYGTLEASLRKPPREVSGILRVAATLTVGLYELPHYLTAFMKQYPKIDLQVTYLRASELYEAVLTSRVDVGVVAYPNPHSQLKEELFKKDRLVLIVPPGHALSKLKRLSLKRLTGEPFITMESGLLTRKALDRILRKHAVRVNIVHEFDNIELIKRAVEVGVGISILPLQTIRTEVEAGTLRQIELVEGPFEHPIKIVTKKYAERSLPVQKFVQSLPDTAP